MCEILSADSWRSSQTSEGLGITIRAIPSEVLMRNRVLYEELG